MNKTDKILTGVIAGSALVGFILISRAQKSNKAKGILGLNPDHSKKFLLGVAVIGGAILVYNSKTVKA